MKAVTQRLWLLSQQQADLEHQITITTQALQQRLELSQVYDKR